MNKPEYILCAAIWYKDTKTAPSLPVNVDRGTVICGHRHHNCIHTLVALTGKRSVTTEIGEYEQGFLTNLNRFVGRKEAAIIALQANQIDKEYEALISEHLYSEDLY